MRVQGSEWKIETAAKTFEIPELTCWQGCRNDKLSHVDSLKLVGRRGLRGSFASEPESETLVSTSDAGTGPGPHELRFVEIGKP
jgi:hypothetical protein